MRETGGQTAVEYLIVFSTALIILAAISMAQMISPATNVANETLHLSQARGAVDAIAGAINTVYSNGPGAVGTVGFQMDVGWRLELDNRNDCVLVMVNTSRGLENVAGNLRYDFENGVSLACARGHWTVVVEWPITGAENLRAVNENRIIFISIKPR